MICSPEMNGNAHLFFNHSLIVEMLQLWDWFAIGGHGNLQTYCPKFCGNQTHRRSHRLYSWDPAEHLHSVNPCNFRTLDRFKHSWLATAADIWNGLPADMIVQGEASGWRTILKDVQCCICT